MDRRPRPITRPRLASAPPFQSRDRWQSPYEDGEPIGAYFAAHVIDTSSVLEQYDRRGRSLTIRGRMQAGWSTDPLSSGSSSASDPQEPEANSQYQLTLYHYPLDAFQRHHDHFVDMNQRIASSDECVVGYISESAVSSDKDDESAYDSEGSHTESIQTLLSSALRIRQQQRNAGCANVFSELLIGGIPHNGQVLDGPEADLLGSLCSLRDESLKDTCSADAIEHTDENLDYPNEYFAHTEEDNHGDEVPRDTDMESRSRYQVPDGLRPLLEALARETLRAQPSDVINFAQLFFDEIQRQRESNPNTDIIKDPIAYEMFRTDLQRRQLELAENGSRCASPMDHQAAIKIQAAFRGHCVRAHPEKFGVEKVMTRTQSSEKMVSLNNKKDLKRHSVGGYAMDDVDTPEDRAATKIQAEIRGFLARKQVSKQKVKVEKMKKEDNQAATKIQARIRGFLTRKHLDEQGLLSPSRSRSSLHSSQSDVLDM